MFDHPDYEQMSSQLLLQLRQGSETATNYAIRFRILAAESEWNDAVLMAVFCRGLAPELQQELVCREAL